MNSLYAPGYKQVYLAMREAGMAQDCLISTEIPMALSGEASAAVAVVGAGSEDVDGLYVRTSRVWHDAPVFENGQRCMLSREPHKSQKTGVSSYGWIIGQDRKPLYAVQSDSLVPPTVGWKKFTGLLPIPHIQSSDSLEDAAEMSASALKEQGNALFAARSYKEAAAKWSRALAAVSAAGPSLSSTLMQLSVTLYANRAESQLRQEHWADALDDCQAALKHKPTHEKALLRAAVALKSLRRHGEAREMILRCLEVDAKNQEAKGLLHGLDLEDNGQIPARAKAAKAAKEKLRETLKGDTDFSSIPRAFDTKDVNNKKGFAAFEGYSKLREKEEQVPISELPYHKMGLPDAQVELMDTFFREIRASKKQQAMHHKREITNYELVKNEYRERVLEDRALGRQDPIQLHAKETKEVRDADPPLCLVVKKKQDLVADRVGLSGADKAEIDALFSGFKPAKTVLPSPDQRTSLEKQLDAEEEAERRNLERQADEELKTLQASRKGEPTRFEQAGGEVYCWWTLPAGIKSKDIEVQTSKGGAQLLVLVRGIPIFDRQLFHNIRGDDVLWSLDAGELSLTLTKAERNKLWDQLGTVCDIQVDASGKPIPSSIPEPMSASDRLQKFKQMVEGDDGHQARYEELGDTGKQLVDAMRRFEHARATGDQNALSLAEHDLEELGRVVI